MLTFPNAKINLGLNIIGRRPDGYHDLETVFYPIPLEDALEITPLQNPGRLKYALHLHGQEVAGNPEDNLVVKAYVMLDKDFDLPPTDIHLFKHIPSGAGLGGGSSDAAFMLKMLNEAYGIGLTEDRLEEYAARLGADCAFFIRNKPVFAEGIGKSVWKRGVPCTTDTRALSPRGMQAKKCSTFSHRKRNSVPGENSGLPWLKRKKSWAFRSQMSRSAN